ncbi:MAG: FkbM family methyltransferase [Candidatus Caldarchaeum sp.]
MTGHGFGLRVWLALWWVGYVFLRVVLRVLIGKERRRYVQDKLGIHPVRAYGVFYGNIEPYEAQVSRVVRNIFKQNGRVFVDVGAYFGYYVQMVDKLTTDARIVAVEPDPVNLRVLRNRVAGCRNMVRVVSRAVWLKDDDEVEFHRGNPTDLKLGLSMCGSILRNERAGFLSGFVVKVKTIRLDTLINLEGVEAVDLVKMDVEGAELPILCDPTLDLSKVKNMIVEVHYNYLSGESRRILSSLMKNGFRVVPLYPDNKANSYHLLAAKGEVPW